MRSPKGSTAADTKSPPARDELTPVKDVLAEVLHFQNRRVRTTGKRPVWMGLGDLADDDMVITLLNDRAYAAFKGARSVNEDRRVAR